MKKYKEKIKVIKMERKISFKSMLVVLGVVVASWLFGTIFGSEIFHVFNAQQEKAEENIRPTVVRQPKPVSLNIPSSSLSLPNTKYWKNFRSQKYEFEIKYPGNWNVPSEKYLSRKESKYDYQISFRDFDILIRDDSKPESMENENSSSQSQNKYILASYQPELKSQEKPEDEAGFCAEKEIRFIKNDFYFKKVYVYQVVKGKYTYDVIPTVQKDDSSPIILASASVVVDTAPSVKEVLSTFKFKKADPIVVKPRVVRPAQLSCKEKNYGNPSKSDTKGKHMDEDCCPDPDEWPKPGCVYDAHGYGIMLPGPPKSKSKK